MNFRPPADGNEAADYLDRYAGFLPDRSSFVRASLQRLGWSEALEHLASEQGMWPDDVAWNEDVLWEHLAKSYVLVEHYGGVYVFRR